ncbi:ribbon-helix-helix domain-containing protein [Luteipulveratus mongoliensis]|uniref:Ribbon-helix-helix protein CopG domain-containing protein n=1 Tax=Luteipulveratus mongoliensis TaxID=571913 RepID=A0A0K1JMG4_9MICO|nr:ribbon-helix-helix protein, CopG family [Luteipulveratus mongoliensis]AKU17904.1 hypothetical protein VV02_21985 [Luteipulveratus mongoliensis]
MSTQIAVRLPDDQVAFIDEMVQRGDASSRADVVKRALDRERRRQQTLRDVEILRAAGGNPYPDLDGWLTEAAGTPMDDLD